MYTLLNGLYKYLTRQEEYYVIILGLDNAGKTTLLERIKTMFTGVRGLSPDKIGPTVGLNLGKIDIGRSRLKFWDLGGQRDLHSIWERYYPESHAIIFVIDATDRARLEECRQTLEKVMMTGETEGVPVLMLANKQDLPVAMPVEEIKETFNKIAYGLGARESKVLPVSALAGDGVRDAIEWLYTRLQFNRETRPPNIE
ncbi:ADP-ribosylation factor protein 3 [Dimargaris cristalligena]|uniref:ADP-ribosylation factor family-domain-containing protein n=1 Tax=Dimargaris cristalligena TaxID=215637 RepID=A0A4Q0A2G8_9FUNG|nr:ADP-ribosylation factor protein 3 [Dimargaris cristalligena]RKP40326.1 ADP-ribosylation factor family-domain-containing protein [Dimargaris cristalligena]|eukprot:RKP40326.1 ADP-ribosylation factor family-domain-containing protein [Dimargaris cristalligena]